MHDAFKQYWLVAGLSDDHPHPDSAPQRSTILGEDYVLSRDRDGHLVCVADFAGGRRSYPVEEIGGMAWVYLGPDAEPPPPPDYYWLHLPPECFWVAPTVFEANYAQVLDGGADSSHLTILHQDALARQLGSSDEVRTRILTDAAPRFGIHRTQFGQYSVAIRQIPGPGFTTLRSARASAFVAPSTVIVPGGRPDRGSPAIAVPVNDHRTIFYIISFDGGRPLETEAAKNEARSFMGLDPDTMDDLGISRSSCDRSTRFGRHNRWTQDRTSMSSGASFTGLPLFIPEDIAVAESMGPIYDRTQEHLVAADLPIIGIRRILLEMARDVQSGRRPIGLRSPVDTRQIVCNEATLADGEEWVGALVPAEFRTATVR
jgi:phthalate 4,5-dioxygenase oxygenase subunit